MKTRIISGIVMGVVVAAALALGLLWNSIVITAFIAVLAAMAVYELLHNAVGIKSKVALIGACIYSVLVVFTTALPIYPLLFLSVIYFLFGVCVVLKYNKEFTLADISSLCALPLALSFSFYCLCQVINF